MDTKKVARILLGMIKCGTYKYAHAEQLRQIIEEWQGYTTFLNRKFAQEEASFLASLTPNERIAYEVICEHTTTGFEILHRAWPSPVTDDAIEKILKGLRRKIRKCGHDFIISGAHRHVTWKEGNE